MTDLTDQEKDSLHWLTMSLTLPEQGVALYFPTEESRLERLIEFAGCTDRFAPAALLINRNGCDVRSQNLPMPQLQCNVDDGGPCI